MFRIIRRADVPYPPVTVPKSRDNAPPQASGDPPAEPIQPTEQTNVAPPDGSDPEALIQYLRQGNLLVVSKRRRNGLIIYKQFHAEFAGPGAAVGGLFDANCDRVIPVGDLSLMPPNSHEERQEAYLIRRQWIRLTQQFTDTSVALERARMILNQFETYFDAETVAKVTDEAFALLVGVLPNTIRNARRPPGKASMKVKV
ncbi:MULTISPECIES: hypothetical protein [unclassified Leptolyngbya]|uniref:hypothetical protein n=1 Tax=unclassified Leptolyngbya TaxID=2650499 RepID=UPI001F552D04|nr:MULTISPECIES: hypothetical protein [unclassified Leptolyngbya]